MLSSKRVAVVVPAFNEARLITRTLGSIPDFVDHIVVVDDASDDETFAVASASLDPRVHVVRHEANRGVGHAIRTGYEHAFRSHADVAAVMAGDAQMDARDLTRVLMPIVEEKAEYAKGDRLAWPGARDRMPTLRFVGNHVLSFLTRCATGLRVRDSQCGFTAIARSAYVRLDLQKLWPRYGYPNDLLGRASLAGIVVKDVPVRPVYADEQSGIGWRHALVVIPYVLLCVAMRRFVGLRKPARVALTHAGSIHDGSLADVSRS